MKKSRLLWVLLAVMASLALIVVVSSCDKDKDDDNSGTSSGTPPGQVSDWTIAKQPENAFTGTFSVAKDGDALAIKWGDSRKYSQTDLHGKIPSSVSSKLTSYDGLTFDIKLEDTNNYLILIRKQGSAGAWKLKEEYIESGDWRKVSFGFDDATPEWFATAPSGTLMDYLNAEKTSEIHVWINPIVNPGAPEDETKLNKQYTTYIRNVGFYKGDDAPFIVWKP